MASTTLSPTILFPKTLVMKSSRERDLCLDSLSEVLERVIEEDDESSCSAEDAHFY